MHTLHYMDEIKPVEEIKEISESKVPEIDKDEISLGKILVENLTGKSFDISRYHDEYIEDLKVLIKTKAKGEVQVVSQAVKKPRETQDNCNSKGKFSKAVTSKRYRSKRLIKNIWYL